MWGYGQPLETFMNKRSSSGGFTVVEVVIVTAIFSLILAVAVNALTQSNKSLSQGVLRTSVDDTASRIMTEIVGELRQVSPSNDAAENTDDDDDSDLSLAPGAGGSAIRFRKAGAWNDTKSIPAGPPNDTNWSAFTVTWGFQRAATTNGYKVGESPNGLDENGNGLRDEGVMLRSETTVPATVTRKGADLLLETFPDYADANTVDDNANGIVDETGDKWIRHLTVLDIAMPFGTMKSRGCWFERGASPRDDQIIVTITAAGKLEDSSIYVRQLRETVLLRN